MDLVSIPDNYSIFIGGQLSNLTRAFSMPFSGSAVVYPKKKTVDLYFGAVVEQDPTEHPDIFNYFILSDICNAIGCTGLDIAPENTTVTLVRNGESSQGQGRTGYKYAPNSNIDGALGRAYTDDIKNIGGWPMNAGDPDFYLLKGKDYFQFTIIGAKIVFG